jgi:archaellum component FlaC
MDDKLNTIENEIKELKKIVLLLTEKIDNINKNIDNNVVTECKKMGEHINFVDGVYSNIKRPMWYLCNRINYCIGRNYINNLDTKLIVEKCNDK